MIVTRQKRFMTFVARETGVQGIMLKLEDLTDEQLAYGFTKMLTQNLATDEDEVTYVAYLILDKSIQDLGGRIRIGHTKEAFDKVDENLSIIEGMYVLGRDKAMIRVLRDIIVTLLATNNEIWDNKDYKSVLYSIEEGVDEDIEDLFEKEVFPIKDIFKRYKSSIEGLLFIPMRDLTVQAVIMGQDSYITRIMYQKLIESKVTNTSCWNYLYEVVKKEHRKYQKEESSIEKTFEKTEAKMMDELAYFITTVDKYELYPPDMSDLKDLDDWNDMDSMFSGLNCDLDDNEDEDEEEHYWDA